MNAEQMRKWVGPWTIQECWPDGGSWSDGSSRGSKYFKDGTCRKEKGLNYGLWRVVVRDAMSAGRTKPWAMVKPNRVFDVVYLHRLLSRLHAHEREFLTPRYKKLYEQVRAEVPQGEELTMRDGTQERGSVGVRVLRLEQHPMGNGAWQDVICSRSSVLSTGTSDLELLVQDDLVTHYLRYEGWARKLHAMSCRMQWHWLKVRAVEALLQEALVRHLPPITRQDHRCVAKVRVEGCEYILGTGELRGWNRPTASCQWKMYATTVSPQVAEIIELDIDEMCHE